MGAAVSQIAKQRSPVPTYTSPEFLQDPQYPYTNRTLVDMWFYWDDQQNNYAYSRQGFPGGSHFMPRHLAEQFGYVGLGQLAHESRGEVFDSFAN